MATKNKEYPQWICMECGLKYGRKGVVGLATWHNDKCDICGEMRDCTEPRDFSHLKPGWEKHKT